MTEKEFKVLLNKYLGGNASVEEEKMLMEFEQNAISKYQNDAFKDEIEKDRIKGEIYSGLRQVVLRKRFSWLAVAATITVLLGIGMILWYTSVNDSGFTIVSNNSDQFKAIDLNDGSTVMLNKNSEIRFKNDYQNTRYLELQGEAFFEVTKNKRKPFVVKAGRLHIKVLGTGFNIRETDSTIDVTVASGEVEVSDSERSIILKPDQKARYQIFYKNFKIKKTNHQLFTLWFKNSVKLQTVTMEELAEYLRSKYGCGVKFLDEKAKHVQMSLSIKSNEPLETILSNINYITELKLTKNKNNMIEVQIQK